MFPDNSVFEIIISKTLSSEMVSKRGFLKHGSSQVQNLAVTALCVPRPESGLDCLICAESLARQRTLQHPASPRPVSLHAQQHSSDPETVAHIRQSRPDSGLGCQIPALAIRQKFLKRFRLSHFARKRAGGFSGAPIRVEG